ncbi:DUF308 domain-containing protein [Methylobacterium sp. E-066]|uniref:DUF308 domain-containing protein n=1 Tax=Methylobacterium sp. E-066 TaxID=2836584 RepID=UPI001FBBDD3A|nr:DUF308 domain-containing protein [Methylobacterium sp. E-066]MCJ2138637.1 DUF308 domain-containing protein [Methylobacterium sp. E-066]
MQETASSEWLRTYYFTRAAVAAAWVGAALTIGKSMPPVSIALLIAYPAWDAAANLIDARRSGGLKANPSQQLNFLVSLLTTAAVIWSVGYSSHTVLVVFGVWATLSGLLQLATGVRRWRTGAQWAMVLSGAQSALAGGFIIKRAADIAAPAASDIAAYATFGGFYFLVSAIWLTVLMARSSSTERTA